MVEPEEVEEVAENARIQLEEEEVEKFSGEFEKILEKFDRLEDIDTDEVDPAFHPVETEPEIRQDDPEETLEREEVFTNTGNEEDGMFKGPSV